MLLGLTVDFLTLIHFGNVASIIPFINKLLCLSNNQNSLSIVTDQDLGTFQKHLQCSIINRNFVSVPAKQENHFVLFISNNSQLFEYLHFLEDNNYSQIRKKYLVVVRTTYTAADVKELYELFWWYSVVSVTIFFDNKFWTWNPFNGYCGTIVEPYELDETNENEKLVYKNCILRIAWHFSQTQQQIPNLDLINEKFFNVFGEKTGTMIVYLDDNPIYRYEYHRRGTIRHQLIADMRNRTVDVLAGYIIIGDCEIPGLSCTRSVFNSGFHWVYAKTLLAFWKNLYVVFTWKLWLLNLFTTILLALILKLLFWRQNISLSYQIFRILGMCIGNADLPQSTALSSRIFYWFRYFIIIFCFYMNTTYSSKLTSITVTPLFNPKLQNEMEILRSNIPIRLTRLFKESIQNEGVYSSGKLAAKSRNFDYLNSELLTDIINDLLQRKNYATVSTHYVLRKNASYLDELHNFYMKSMDLVFLMRISHPLLTVLDRYLLLCKEYGLFNIWERYKLQLNKGTYQQEFVRLSLNHLQGANFLLILGLVMALITFICENVMPQKNHT